MAMLEFGNFPMLLPAITVRVALYTSKIVCDISEIKGSLYFVIHISVLNKSLGYISTAK
jgi:hypothetical protein